MKTCRLCQLAKPTTEFQKNRAVCKSCRRAQQASWRLAQQVRLNQKQREWKKQNPDIAREINRRWREANPEKAKQLQQQWCENNRPLVRAYCSTRRKKVQQATPPWANIKKITEIYLNCPKGYHVDHIIPLRGKTVCGLHVETNLQYLPATDNMKKGNKFESD